MAVTGIPAVPSAVVSALLLLSGCSSPASDTTSDAAVDDCATAYSEYLARYPNKTSSEESRARFCQRKEMVEAHNGNQNNTWTMGLNERSDWSAEQFSMMSIESMSSEFDFGEYTASENLSSLASSMDWRAHMPAIKNQHQCGSCWAFAAVAVLDFIGTVHSEQQLVDCVTDANGCSGGNSGTALRYYHEARVWAAMEDQYPYLATEGTCRPHPYGDVWASNVQRLEGVDAIRSALQYGVVATSIELAEHGPLNDYAGGVFSGQQCGTGAGHALAIVGYHPWAAYPGDSYWIVRNSWGSDWGINGHVYFVSGYDLCTIETRGNYIADVNEKASGSSPAVV